MHNEEKVTRIRRLIADASAEKSKLEHNRHRVVRHIGESFPIEGLQRRAMLKQLDLAATRYGLQQDIDVFVALAGSHTLRGLSTEHLRVLIAWCSATMDRMATGSDCPDSPPAF